MSSSPLPESQAPPAPTARPRSRPDWWLFLTKFLRHGRAIAALAPSSPWLARELVRGIDFGRARAVVELGAGTGPVTAELLRLAPATCRLVIVERDPDFCRRLRERFPAADVVETDAIHLDGVLAARGIGAVDHFVCGLPLPSFPAAARDRVLAVVARRLAAEGTFRQLTHLPGLYYPLYARYFADVGFQFVLRNLPPGGFYVCRGARDREGQAGGAPGRVS
jgi:phospholipid N-methyltransferase